MITWVDSACKAWGRCVRWINADTGEGYPSSDTIAKARDGLLNVRASGLAAQKFGEVLVGDALEVARAMHGEPEAGWKPMREDLAATLYVHYVVIRAKTRQRIDGLAWFLRVDISKDQYFDMVGAAHVWLEARIPERSEVVATTRAAPHKAQRLTV